MTDAIGSSRKRRSGLAAASEDVECWQMVSAHFFTFKHDKEETTKGHDAEGKRKGTELISK